MFCILILNHELVGFLTNTLFNEMTNNSLISLTFNEYQKGNWSNKKFTAADLYHKVSPELSDLVKKIVVKKLLSNEGDAYERIFFSFTKGVENKYSAIKFTRKDYYSTLRNYCVLLRYYFLTS